MAYTIKFPDEVTEQMVREMSTKIDPVCYPELQLDPEHELAIYRANNLSNIALLQDGSLIGHLCLFPISDKAFGEIMAGSTAFLDRPEISEILQYQPGGHYKLLLDSMAILPRRQKLVAAEMLLDAAFAFISILSLRGTEIDEIIFYAPSADLLPLIKRASFKKARTASNGMTIYSSKTPDRRRRDSIIMRKKIDGVIAVLANYSSRPAKEINGNTGFAADLGLSPDDMATIKPLIEKKMGFPIPDDKYAALQQVKDLAYLPPQK